MYTLSLILNLHQEGKILFKTLENIKNIMLQEHAWHHVEVIAVLDKSNRKTKEIVHEHRHLFACIDEVSYGDLAHSRNHGVQLAHNNFIVFADGDDYASHTMLQALYKKFYTHYNTLKIDNVSLANLSLQKHIALFPQHLVWFPEISKMTYADSNPYLLQNNKFNHCYISKIAAYKGLLKAYPLHPNDAPYGYEDWDFNNRMLAIGVKFEVALYTLYYRKENENSLLEKQLENKYIVRNSIAYSKEKMYVDTEQPQNSLMKKVLKKLFKHFHKTHIVIAVPHSIKEDIQFLMSYENTKFTMDHVQYYDTTHFHTTLSSQVQCYRKLLELMDGKKELSIDDNQIDSSSNALLLHEDIEWWNLLNEEEKHHVFIKAIINSHVSVLDASGSMFAQKNICYFSRVYDEFKIQYSL